VKKNLKDNMFGGELVTAKYVSAVYVYILYTQLSGRLRCHFRIVWTRGPEWDRQVTKHPVSSIVQSWDDFCTRGIVTSHSKALTLDGLESEVVWVTFWTPDRDVVCENSSDEQFV